MGSRDRFLQWFPNEQQALDAIEDFAEIIRDKFPGWKVSRPRQRNAKGHGRGWMLYAIPPGEEDEG